jgi:hypothetical protein
MQAAADPKFAHTLRRQRLGDHSVGRAGRTDGGGGDSGSSTPAYNQKSASSALQRAVAAVRLSPDQARTITGAQPVQLLLDAACLTSHDPALLVRHRTAAPAWFAQVPKAP